jgi:hypothetical protein
MSQHQPLLCADYELIAAVQTWPAREIQRAEREGSRVYYTTGAARATSSATTSTVTLTETVLLQLPMQFVPVGPKQCIPTPVIGIALDGSLIKNQESSLYRLFTNETLIGYALDGFPIYGLSEAATDECGGRIVQGQYRYELADTRPTIINCFNGVPQTVP